MMRELLDKLDLLVESTGLANRKPGDVFKNDMGDQIIFKSIEFYPKEGGKYDNQQLTDIVLQLGNKVHWQNKQPKTGGIAIANFDTNQGPMQYGFFRQEIYPNRYDNKIKNSSIPGFNFSGKAAEKIQSGLTPQDLLEKKNNLTQKDIIDQLAKKLGEENPLVQLAIRIANGEKFPIKFPAPEGISYTGFRDYFCEILQPMAIQNGQYEGNAGEAAKIFFDGSFNDTLISFDDAKNKGLSDSILSKADGKYIKISTKGGRGAPASIKALSDSLKELEASPIGKKLLKTYSDTVELIEEILSRGQVGAPLYLGVKYGIISDEDKKQILSLRRFPSIDLNNIDQLNISDNLKKLAKERETENPKNVNLYYHLLASVAHLAAKEVNTKTDFSKTATDILNNGALIQVYTISNQSKDEWTLEKFDTVYPSESIKGVYLSAGKTYFSTQIKGNFTFIIDKGGKKPEKEQNKEKGAATTEPPKNQKDFMKAAEKIARGSFDTEPDSSRAGEGPGRSKRPKLKDKSGVKRKKRK